MHCLKLRPRTADLPSGGTCCGLSSGVTRRLVPLMLSVFLGVLLAPHPGDAQVEYKQAVVYIPVVDASGKRGSPSPERLMRAVERIAAQVKRGSDLLTSLNQFPIAWIIPKIRSTSTNWLSRSRFCASAQPERGGTMWRPSPVTRA